MCNSCRKLLKAQTIILRLQNLKAIKILVCNSYTTLSKLLLLWLHRQRVFEAFFVFCFILRCLFYTVLLSPKNHLIDPTYVHFFKKMDQNRPLFVYFRLFHITQFNKLMKALIVCLGLEPGAAGWKAQTNPQSYGGTQLNSSLYSLFLMKNPVRVNFLANTASTVDNFP